MRHSTPTKSSWPEHILGPDRTVPTSLATKHFVESADGVRVVLYRWRDWNVNRPTVLFQHANGFNAGVYLPFLDLVGQRCNILAVDQRGHGAADKPDPKTPLDINDYYATAASGEDLRAVIDFIATAFDVSSVHLVSHSLGGLGAICYAASGDQDAFATMTLFEPPLIPGEGNERDVSVRRALGFADWAETRAGFFETTAEFELAFNQIQTYQTFSSEMRESHLAGLIAKTDNGFVLRCPGPVEAQIYRRNAANPISHLVSKITVPGLLFCSDPALNRGQGWFEHFKRIAAPSPGISMAVMEGCHHLMVQEAPARCAEMVFQQVLK